MYLKEIINTKSNINFHDIKLNSNDVNKHDLFIPFGGVSDRNKYINMALKKGCSAIITDKKYNNKKVFLVDNLNKEIIDIFDIYYDFPLKNTHLIGITGTDGKTTISSIISDMLKCPSIGTNGFKFKGSYLKLDNTTPSIDILYKCFNKSREFKNIVMEVSSEAYLTKRIGDLEFDVGVFSNITKDHLDKHKNIDNYINCKLELFKHSKIGILNHDSKYYNLFKNNCKKSLSYGFNKKSDLRIIKYKLYIDNSIIWFKYNKKIYKVKYNLVGVFNVYNIACSILTLISLGYDMNDILKRISNVKSVLGRMDVVYNKKYKIVIDYAHTENSTLNVLKFYRKYSRNIITIVGCAGGRYKDKRKVIGDIVLKYSKLVIFTMDDPRYEDVNLIIKEMIDGSKKKNYLVIEERSMAIEKGISLCKKNYILLILGKGHDNYMLINNLKIPYSDYSTVLKLIS
ncbi:MAG: UDP-N-acetylmuramoyl-L-alanyl-D-glutamate--2,6-diaminopimelate ligase [Bacilli bacterium]|nr:UDP-N-acetylmuramoyl-L-alanyl-D-glutamate--2,6-diaminopimelate ligase [Bacilli bacterium]